MRIALALATALVFPWLGCTTTTVPASAPADLVDGGAAPDGAPPAEGPDAAYERAVLAAAWTKLANGPTLSRGAKQDDVFFTSPDVGYVANGPDSTIYKTTDGGETWTESLVREGTFFRALLFTNERHGFAGNLGTGLSDVITDPNVLYETKDAGGTWAPVTAITGDAPSGICNLTALDDGTHLFAVGRANGPSHLITSKDGGATWVSKDVTTTLRMLIDAHFSSPTEGILAGMGTGASSTCTIVRTTDGGATFSEVFASATPNSLCWKLDFPSKDVGYVAIQDATDGPGSFAKTTDGGVTWTEMPLPEAEAYPAIAIGFITEKVGWVTPGDPSRASYRTDDGGSTWTVETALKAPINRFRFVDKKTAYAVGGAIWKLSVEWDGN